MKDTFDNSDEFERATKLNDRMVRTAIKMGETATGEHGVGIGKRKFMRKEHPAGVNLMATIKEAIDQGNLESRESVAALLTDYDTPR